MRYPCSYMIYSPAFDALPKPMKEAFYHRLPEVLSGEEKAEKYRRLSAADRQAIFEILRETKSGARVLSARSLQRVLFEVQVPEIRSRPRWRRSYAGAGRDDPVDVAPAPTAFIGYRASARRPEVSLQFPSSKRCRRCCRSAEQVRRPKRSGDPMTLAKMD